MVTSTKGTSTANFLCALVLVGLFASCGQQRNAVVGEGMFQKRKYTSGWHVDLGKRRAPRHMERPLEVRRERPLPPSQPPKPLGSATADPITYDEYKVTMEPIASLSYGPLLQVTPDVTVPEALTASPTLQDPDPDNIMPRKRFNVLAVPALLFVLGGIMLAFVTNSGWLVSGALFIGLVLAAISLRRVRSREQSGKGFALIAMILGVMAALITAMVIIRTGF